MPHYAAPIDDDRFYLLEVLNISHYAATVPGLEAFTPAFLEAFLAEGERFCRDILLPLNGTGDAQGVSFSDGNVTLPQGFADAYRQYCEGGLSDG